MSLLARIFCSDVLQHALNLGRCVLCRISSKLVPLCLESVCTSCSVGICWSSTKMCCCDLHPGSKWNPEKWGALKEKVDLCWVVEFLINPGGLDPAFLVQVIHGGKCWASVGASAWGVDRNDHRLMGRRQGEQEQNWGGECYLVWLTWEGLKQCW